MSFLLFCLIKCNSRMWRLHNLKYKNSYISKLLSLRSQQLKTLQFPLCIQDMDLTVCCRYIIPLSCLDESGHSTNYHALGVKWLYKFTFLLFSFIGRSEPVLNFGVHNLSDGPGQGRILLGYISLRRESPSSDHLCRRYGGSKYRSRGSVAVLKIRHEYSLLFRCRRRWQANQVKVACYLTSLSLRQEAGQILRQCEYLAEANWLRGLCLEFNFHFVQD